MKIAIIFSFFFCCNSWSQECNNRAQTVTEIKEDYASFAELVSELSLKYTALAGVSDPVLRVEIESKIRSQLIYGEMAFTVYPKSLKGEKLFKKVFSDCVAEEKRTTERRSKQAARDAAKAAK
ncbi:hypothetical protein [Limnohabitans sp. Rim8]|uniref:hypothetical protein n=1 Tax=Limnohabitans sp. Rim8 TaxID=1100718 RepID=UPI0025FAC583|nr:hypothetical protein [Limnohabitans sp. Rim8]